MCCRSFESPSWSSLGHGCASRLAAILWEAPRSLPEAFGEAPPKHAGGLLRRRKRAGLGKESKRGGIQEVDRNVDERNSVDEENVGAQD